MTNREDCSNKIPLLLLYVNIDDLSRLGYMLSPMIFVINFFSGGLRWPQHMRFIFWFNSRKFRNRFLSVQWHEMCKRQLFSIKATVVRLRWRENENESGPVTFFFFWQNSGEEINIPVNGSGQLNIFRWIVQLFQNQDGEQEREASQTNSQSALNLVSACPHIFLILFDWSEPY